MSAITSRTKKMYYKPQSHVKYKPDPTKRTPFYRPKNKPSTRRLGCVLLKMALKDVVVSWYYMDIVPASVVASIFKVVDLKEV